MARVLIVGCGCRGQALARAVRDAGHLARGTTRSPSRSGAIAAAGAEAELADPGDLATVMECLDGVTVAAWLLGSASGDPAAVAALHRERLEHLLRRLVDTPVRGFLYEAAGSLPGDLLDGGAGLVSAAGQTWSMPVEIVRAEPSDHGAWLRAAAAGVERLLAQGMPGLFHPGS